jgi:hypothetical protein
VVAKFAVLPMSVFELERAYDIGFTGRTSFKKIQMGFAASMWSNEVPPHF